MVALVACPYNNNDFMGREDISFDDLGLGYLYVSLQNNGYSVVLFDSLRPNLSFYPPYRELEEKLVKLKPDYIGFSDSLITFKKSLRLSQSLKKQLPQVKIIYGDIHASMYNKEIMENEEHVDFVICGDGDHSFPMLIDALENQKDFSMIPGLTYRNENQVIETPVSYQHDLNSLPFPFRPSLYDLEVNPDTYYNIVSSRGCSGHCTFCSVGNYLTKHCSDKNHRWRPRSAENIFAEIHYLYKQGVRNLAFHDDNIIGNRDFGLQRMTRLCELIIKNNLENLSFSAAVRPDILNSDDIEFLLLMKKAGLTTISFGLEAGNEKQLKFYGKKYDQSVVKKLIPLLLESNIMVRAGFIMFYPYSTFDMLKQNSRFLAEVELFFMFTCFSNKLMPTSKLPMEKRLKNDDLLVKPTTYNEMGVYTFQDKRIDELQKFISTTMYPENETLIAILIASTDICKRAKLGGKEFKVFRESLKKIGDATVNFFNFCVDTFEAAENVTDAIRTSYKYSNQWSRIVGKEKIILKNHHNLK